MLMSKIVNFSKQKKYKIILVSLAGVGALFLMIGLILNISATPPIVTQMRIMASGGSWQGGVFQIETGNRVTPIRVDALTSGGMLGTEPVTFSFYSGDNLARITPSIRSGDYAYLTLLTDESGVPFFHDDAIHNAGRITINVNSGLSSAQIRVIIRTCSSHAQVNSRVERWTQDITGFAWRPVETISEFEFRNNPGTFRVFAEFKVRDFANPSVMHVRYNTLNNLSLFSETNLNEFGTGVQLLTTGGIQIPSGYIHGETLHFMISVNFGGMSHFGFLNLDIVA